LTNILNGLSGSLGIECGPLDPGNNTASCNFLQDTINGVFGQQGLALSGCSFGECVAQGVIDTANSTDSGTTAGGGKSLSAGVIAGLAVVGGLIALALVLLLIGLINQRKARKEGYVPLGGHHASIEWSNITYLVSPSTGSFFGMRKSRDGVSSDKAILDAVNGRVGPGEMMAILGPSGAGKTTLVEILAGKAKSGAITGGTSFISPNGTKLDRAELRVGFVPQQDILPPMLTVQECLMFAARLRLPEGVSDVEKRERVASLMEKLGISSIMVMLFITCE
jgi:ABC-type multidrug transport system fused ATPase/permease subunit